MKVYSVFGIYTGIIEVIGCVGVFSTLEKAEAAIEDMKKEHFYDHYSIKTMTVDKVDNVHLFN